MLSIVIPAYNEEKFIHRILESLKLQDRKDFEVIVVDNNSTDRTAEIALQYGAKVIFQPLTGVSKARQTGFEAAQFDIIATTDADTYLPEYWVSHILEKFQNDQELVAYGGLYKLYSGPRLAQVLFPNAAYYLLWRPDKVLNKGWSLAGANMAVRKSAFSKVGGFNTDLHIMEDADLSQRLKHFGKVTLNKNFLVYTSGRRYRKGVVRAMWDYIPNGVSRIVFKKSVINKLKPVRTESFSFASLILPTALIILSVVFWNHKFIIAKAAQAEDHSEYTYHLKRQQATDYWTVNKPHFIRSLKSPSEE